MFCQQCSISRFDSSYERNAIIYLFISKQMADALDRTVKFYRFFILLISSRR